MTEFHGAGSLAQRHGCDCLPCRYPEYVVTFATDGGSTGEVRQPARGAVTAVRAVNYGFAHIGVCDAPECPCHRRGSVVIDGWGVPEPVPNHAGALHYIVTTPGGQTLLYRVRRIASSGRFAIVLAGVR